MENNNTINNNNNISIATLDNIITNLRISTGACKYDDTTGEVIAELNRNYLVDKIHINGEQMKVAVNNHDLVAAVYSYVVAEVVTDLYDEDTGHNVMNWAWENLITICPGDLALDSINLARKYLDKHAVLADFESFCMPVNA